MAELLNHARKRWLIVVGVAALVVGTFAAVGWADHTPEDQIVFINDLSSGDMTIHLNGVGTQTISTPGPKCRAASGGDDIVTITAQGNTSNFGLVEDGLGVSENRGGNAQSCGRTDWLGSSSERLTLSLGSDVENSTIEYFQFDFEAKFDAIVRFEFLNGAATVATGQWQPGDTSDEGPDSKFNDKYRVYTWIDLNGTVQTDSMSGPTGDTINVDGIRISMLSGGVALEGGADWQFSDQQVETHRTVFYLKDTSPGVSVVKKTNGQIVDMDDAATAPLFLPVYDSNVEPPAVNEVEWTYEVTNSGNVPLENIALTDDQLPTDPAYDSGDAGTIGVLEVGETWVFVASDDVEAGEWLGGAEPYSGYVNLATVTADSTNDGSEVTDMATSGYYGSDPSLSISCTITADELPCDSEDPAVVNVDQDVVWNFTIENDGNVPLTALIVKEIADGTLVDLPAGDTDCDDLGSLDPGASATCQYTEEAEVGDQGTEFVVIGTDPDGETTSGTSGDVGYVGNTPPSASDDSYGMDERVSAAPDMAATLIVPGPDLLPDLLTNDTDGDGDPLSTVVVSNGTSTNGGTVDIGDDGSLEYTPLLLTPDQWADLPDQFEYTDTFEYTVTDGNGSDTGTVSILVNRVICTDDTVRGSDPDNPNFYGEFTQLPNEITGETQCKDYFVTASEAGNEVTLEVPPGQGPEVFFSGVLSGPTEEPSADPGTLGDITVGLTYDRDLAGALWESEPLLACDGSPTLVDGLVVGAALPVSDGIGYTGDPGDDEATEAWCLALVVAPASDGVLTPLHYVYGREDPGFRFK